MSNKTEIPRNTGDNDNYGLTKVKGKYYAIYYEGSKTKRVSLSTDDVGEARLLRDQFYTSLRKRGATVRGDKRMTQAELALEEPDADHCIYETTTYKVMINGEYIGSSPDKETARKIRDKHLNNKSS